MKPRGSIDWKALTRGVLATGVWLATSAFAAGTTDDALLNCRAQADTAARLACYDAIALLPAPGPGAPAALVTPAAGATAPRASTTPTAAFGLERQRRPDAVDEVRSTIGGVFEGWGPGTRFTLANGQVWEVSDGSRGVYNLSSPQVTVRRATMGTFQLEVDGAGKAPRVQRVR